MAARKPSTQSSQFEAPKKSTPQEIERGALGIGAQREIAPGVTVSQEISLENLLPSGAVSGAISDTDAGTEISIGIGGKINTPLGRFGITGGGAIEVTDDGEISIKESTVGIEIGGVGVETSVDRQGRRSVSLCYSYGVSETCIKLGPPEEPDTSTPTPTPTPPTPTPLPPPGMPLPSPSPPNLSCSRGYADVKREIYAIYDAGKIYPRRYNNSSPPPSLGDTIAIPPGSTAVLQGTGGTRYYYYNSGGYTQIFNSQFFASADFKSVSSDSFTILNQLGRAIATDVNVNVVSYARETIGYDTVNNQRIYGDWILLSTEKSEFKCFSTPAPSKPISLPNLPQETKPMDKCCELVKEIHKYLGIEKLKRNGFPIASAFLAPTDNPQKQEKEKDFYEVMQALIRMLANGLIINPKCSPQGQPYQSANATAWAGEVYEMIAESVSDGNLTQKYEISAMMQISQVWAKIAEIDTKLDCIMEALEINDPDVIPTEIPCCFDIFEPPAQKGFDPKTSKERKEVDTDSSKRTDEQVEATINRMLVPSTLPILKYQFKPGAISVVEALRR